jgi:hypothetical protein
VPDSVTGGIPPAPGYYTLPGNFLKPNAAFAPRQVQLGVKLVY